MTNIRYVLIMFLTISALVLMIENRYDRSKAEPEITITVQPTVIPSYPVMAQLPRVVEKYDFPFLGDSQTAHAQALTDAANRVINMAQPNQIFRWKAEKYPGRNKFLVTIYQVK